MTWSWQKQKPKQSTNNPTPDPKRQLVQFPNARSKFRSCFQWQSSDKMLLLVLILLLIVIEERKHKSLLHIMQLYETGRYNPYMKTQCHQQLITQWWHQKSIYRSWAHRLTKLGNKLFPTTIIKSLTSHVIRHLTKEASYYWVDRKFILIVLLFERKVLAHKI